MSVLARAARLAVVALMATGTVVGAVEIAPAAEASGVRHAGHHGGHLRSHRPQVTVNVANPTVTVGGIMEISGRVSSAALRGRRVLLKQRAGTQWFILSGALIDGHGHFHFHVRLSLKRPGFSAVPIRGAALG